MALPQPSLRLGGGAPWATKAGKVLAHQYDEALGVYKPIPIGATRNSGGWRINKQGLWEKQPENYPRIMFDENANGDLITEPIVSEYIDYFAGTNFGNGASTLVDEPTEISPRGRDNDLVKGLTNVIGATGDRWSFTELIGININNRTFSGEIFIKGTSGQTINFQLKRQAGDFVGTPLIEHTFNGSWQKLTIGSITGLTTSAGVVLVVNADGTSTADEFLFWFPQIQETDNITTPTDGTRAADVVNGTNIRTDLIGQNQGTFHFKSSLFDIIGNYGICLATTGSAANRIQLDSNGANLIFRVTKNSISEVTESANAVLSANTMLDFTITYEPADFKVYLGDTIIMQSNSGDTFTNELDNIRFNNSGNTIPWYARTQRLALWDSVLTPAQVTELYNNGLPALP